MTTTIHNWQDGVPQLRGQWAELVEAHRLNPSLHPDWMDITVRSQRLADHAFIAVARTAQDETAIVPLLPRRIVIGGIPLRCLDLCSNLVSYHAELIADGGHESVLTALLRCRDLPPWDVLRLDNLSAGNRTAMAADSLGTAAAGVLTYPRERSPYVPISADWNSYIASRPKKLRANISRCIRLTQQAGETGMGWYGPGSDTEQLLREILDVESRSWKARENKSIRADSAEGEYYRRLLPWLSDHGLYANVLSVRNRPAAYVLCAKSHGWVGQLKTSFAEDVKDAGFRVIHASLERAFQDAQSEYDFLGDADPHKKRWTDQVRSHESKWIFAPHFRGRLVLAVKNFADRLRRRDEKHPQTTESDE